MVAISKALFLATGVSAATLINRDATTVQNDLKAINSDTVALANQVKSYNGGLAAAIPIAQAENTLDSKIKSSTTDVQNAGTITAAQAGTILNYVSNTLTPNVKTALNALVSKKSQFTAAGLKGTVSGDLSSLRTDTNALSGALVSKAPAGSKAAASKASSSINALFTSAQAAFNS